MEYAVYQELQKAEQLSAKLNGIDKIAGAVVGECDSGVIVAYVTEPIFLSSEGKRLQAEVRRLTDEAYGKTALITTNARVFYALIFAVETSDSARIEEIYKMASK
jgi:hypothetical protein